jgi:hypothetical protein
MIRYVFLAALVAAFATGCAATGKSQSADDDDKTPITGSHLPSKDRTVVKSTTDRNQIDDMARRAQQISSPTKGTN